MSKNREYLPPDERGWGKKWEMSKKRWVIQISLKREPQGRATSWLGLKRQSGTINTPNFVENYSVIYRENRE